MSGRALSLAYLATPLFVLADVAAGWNVRIAPLDPFPRLKWGYYAALLGLGVWMRARPLLAPLLSLAESSVNVLMLVLGFFLPYYALAAGIGEGRDPGAFPFGARYVLNFILSGALACAAFYRNPLVRSAPPLESRS